MVGSYSSMASKDKSIKNLLTLPIWDNPYRPPKTKELCSGGRVYQTKGHTTCEIKKKTVRSDFLLLG